jgi:hypothetical protein
MNKFSNLICILVLSVFCVSISQAADLKVFPCKGIKPMGAIQKLEIPGCERYPCVLKRGSNSSINVQFTSKSRINDLKLKITGMLNNKEVPFMTLDGDHCQNTIQELVQEKSQKCLIKRNQSYNYSYALPVKAEYPTVSVVVKFNLIFGTKSVFCFTFPAKIEN